MKQCFFVILLAIISNAGFAQPVELYKKLPDSLKIKLQDYCKAKGDKKSFLVPHTLPGNNDMSLLKLESKGIYKGNNGKGSDIYSYTPDNMPVMKPDSTFRSNMTVHRPPASEKN